MFKLKNLVRGLAVASLFTAGATQAATMSLYSQNFEGFTPQGAPSACTAASGLCTVNRSALPADSWSGGNTNIFDAQSGTAGSYIADSYAAGGGSGVVSDWLLSPTVTIGNGFTFSFYAKGASDAPAFPDRLQVRMSTNGTSVNVGTTPTGFGDFTTLLLSINPTLAPLGFPTEWTQYTATVSGLSGVTSGRFALRYFLDNDATQGNYIGIDTLAITAVPEPESLAMLGLGLSAMAFARRRKSN